jgi:DNA polymerase III subunit epsilon
MRQVVLDTETTGLEPAQGHRIIEIGCVELVDRKLTGRHYQVYLNPERDIDEDAVTIHGLTSDFLSDKPLFKDIKQHFLAFIDGAELIIHNAVFDLGFINHELNLLEYHPPLESKLSVIDTLIMAREKHPGQRNNLDALCKRYNIDNSARDLHGALLDAEILADLYLVMTGGQTALLLGAEFGQDHAVGRTAKRARIPSTPLKVIHASEEELTEHEACLDRVEKASGRVLWRTP